MHRTFTKFAILGAAFVVLIGLTVLITGKPAMVPGAGVVDDWSFHHLVFSNPGTAPDALAQGRIEQWYKIVNDPRYIMQQMKRNPAEQALGPARDFATLASPFGAPIPGPWPIPRPTPPTPRRTLKEDWNVSLGSGGTVGAGQYPAKFSYNGAASCSDFIVFNTSLAGGTGQATVIAFNKLYSTGSTPCASVPSVAWAYNTTTSDKVVTSVVLSWAGDQVAFISTNSGVAYLNVLRFVNGQGSAYNSPVTPTSTTYTSGTSYSTCKNTAGQTCLLRLPFANSATDTTSSPFVYYAGDILWVGDAIGKVHKFTSVFNGSPVESSNPWASVGVSTALTSPVYDGTHVFVGGANGKLYSINASTAASTASGQLAASPGITDAPVVDPTAGELYVNVSNDNNITTQGAGAGVYQLATTFTGGTGNYVYFNTTTTSLPSYAGTFDNIYYAVGASSGHFFFCNQGELAEIPISDFASNLFGAYQVLTSGASCSPVTENLSGGSDWVFMSVGGSASYTTGSSSSCSGKGCIYNFNVGNGTSTFPFGACGTVCQTSSVPTAGFGVTSPSSGSGTSGIVIDNSTISGTVTGANIYFTTMANGTPCASGQSCGVQVTQAAP